MCDYLGCSNEPAYYDFMGNEVCEDCMNREISEGAEPEGFDAINP